VSLQATTTTVDEGILKTLEWNQRSALSNLLIVEEHMLSLKKEEIPHAWCIVKHYLLACDHHVQEAISHTERLGLDSSKYRDFHKKLSEIGMYPQPKITVPEVVALRTEWRYIIGDPTLGEECEICDTDITPEIKQLMEKIGEINHKKLNRKDNTSNEVNNPQKTLYSIHNNKNSDNKLDNLKDVGMIYGGEQLGYGALKALLWADATYPTGFLGQKISLWGDLIGAGVGIYGGLKFDEPWDLVAALVGGYLTTDLWRHLETMLTPPAVTYTTPAGQQTGSVTYVTQNSVAVKPIPLSTGRYRVTG